MGMRKRRGGISKWGGEKRIGEDRAGIVRTRKR